MTILNNNTLQLTNIGKYKLVNTLKAIDNNSNPVLVTTIKENEKFKTLLINKEKSIIGVNSFKINEKIFNGSRMDSYSNNEHVGLGEIMRLTSIINVIENNLRKIQIFSLNEAIPFHLKYKFKPKIQTDDSMLDILNRIASSEEKKLSNYSQKAEEIFSDIFFNGSINQEHNYYEELPDFIISYVNKIREEKLPWNKTLNSPGLNFKEDLPMELTIQNIKDNKSFFNDLFAKHKIDYKI